MQELIVKSMGTQLNLSQSKEFKWSEERSKDKC